MLRRRSVACLVSELGLGLAGEAAGSGADSSSHAVLVKIFSFMGLAFFEMSIYVRRDGVGE